jgi:hypothetical protein
LLEGEVAQIKGGLQRCRIRVLRLRNELASIEDDLALGSASAASLRAAGQIKIAQGESQMIEQEIHLSEAEANLLGEAGVRSPLKGTSHALRVFISSRTSADAVSPSQRKSSSTIS